MRARLECALESQYREAVAKFDRRIGDRLIQLVAHRRQEFATATAGFER